MKKKFYRKKDNVLRGTKLQYNAGVQQRYIKNINTLVTKMTKETTREIVDLFRSQVSDDFFINQEALAAMDSISLFDDEFELPDFPSASKKKYESKSIASKSRILLNMLTRRFEQLFDQEVPLIVEKMLKSTEMHSKSSINASLKKMTPENFTLKTGLIKKNEKEVYKALIESNVSEFKLIPQTYFNNITNAVMKSISTGKGLPDLVPTLIKGYKQNPDLDKYKEQGIEYYNKKILRKAHLAGLDQTRKAFSTINKQKLVNIGVKQLEWSHSYGGMHPRKSHIKIDGHIFSFANLENEQAALGVPPEDRGLPGEPVNCFTGSTIVSLANGCRNLWRYMYRGDIISIGFNGGEVIECTPNHPILTLRGWITANDLNEGDYLISCQTYDKRVIDNEETKITTTFADIFNSFETINPKLTGFGSKFNFHGDVPEVNVDAIRTDYCLPIWTISISDENIEKFFLSFSDVIMNDFIPCFNSKIFESGFSGACAQKFSFINGEFRHSDLIGIRSISKNYPFVIQNSDYHLATDFETYGKREDTFSFFISRDNIGTISIHGFSFNGEWQDVIDSIFKCGSQMITTNFIKFAKFFQSHSCIQKLFRIEKKVSRIFHDYVYTMESYNGWYNVSSTEITSKNCRCTYGPVINFDDID